MAVAPDIPLLGLAMLAGLAAGYALGCWRTRRLAKANVDAPLVMAACDSVEGHAAAGGKDLPSTLSDEGREPSPPVVPPSTDLLSVAADAGLAPSRETSSTVQQDAAPAEGAAGSITTGISGVDASVSGRQETPPPATEIIDPVLSSPAGKRPRKARASGHIAAAAPPLPVGNLRQVRGIGPRLEAGLSVLGITRLEQLAGWSKEDAARISEALGVGGRVQREDWAGQARRLLAEAVPAPAEDTGPLFPEGDAAASDRPATQSGLLFPELARDAPEGRRRRRKS